LLVLIPDEPITLTGGGFQPCPFKNRNIPAAVVYELLLLKGTGSFRDAITLAAMGYNFRKLMETHVE
jgi:hypothetical protein